MSSSPTGNISSATPPRAQSPSRLPEHDPQVPLSHSISPPPAQEHPPSILSADLTSSHNPSQGPPHHHHSPTLQDVSTERPTKRPRTLSTPSMAAERASSSSDSSSQSGMADNETEADPNQQSERSAPQPAVPPKKKRTRTLTTPHQSAVLHALLAKSRFPTTAMREDVGRQIGLSARKVQIWFQNQRQKARRPQAESAPLTRPPQFGPFPIMTASPSSPYPSPLSGGTTSEMPHPGPSSSRLAVHTPGGSHDSNPPLSGPGMRGWSPSRQRTHSSAEDWESPRRVPVSPETPSRNSQHPLPRLSEGSTSSRDSRGPISGPPPHPSQASHVESSPRFSRTLPPINLSALESRSSSELPYASATSSFPPQPPPSRTLVNVLPRRDSSVRPTSPRSLDIPPPFALQPQPQWDPLTFSPYTRPEFASWSSSSRIGFSPGPAHDRITHGSPSHRRIHLSLGDRPIPLDSGPHSRHMIPSSRSRRLSNSTSAPRSRAFLSDGHVRSDDEAGKD